MRLKIDNEVIPDEYGAGMTEMILKVVHLSIGLSYDDMQDPRALWFCDEIARLGKGIQGNKSEHVCMRYADMRIFATGALKVCVEMMEQDV